MRRSGVLVGVRSRDIFRRAVISLGLENASVDLGGEEEHLTPSQVPNR